MKKDDYLFHIVDLPGSYFITEYQPEELFVRFHITDKKPDIVVNVIDSSNIGRNLFLTTQLIDMHIKVVIALSMFDELEHHGACLDYDKKGKLIGILIISTAKYGFINGALKETYSPGIFYHGLFLFLLIRQEHY